MLFHSFNDCQTFLDIGCGTGEYISFARRFVNYVCGMDISKTYLDRCKSYTINALILADITNLPFLNQSFDCVLCSEVIEHVKPNDIAIREIMRVSRKSVLVSTPNQGIFRILLDRIRKRELLSIDAKVGHINIVRFSEFLAKFKNREWTLSAAFTKNVFPPYLDQMHFPEAVAPIIDLIESIMDKFLPLMGSITIIQFENEEIPDHFLT